MHDDNLLILGRSQVRPEDVHPYIDDCAFEWIFVDLNPNVKTAQVTRPKSRFDAETNTFGPLENAKDSELSPTTRAALNSLAGAVLILSGSPFGITAGGLLVASNLAFAKYYKGNETEPLYLVGGVLAGYASAITQVVEGAHSIGTSLHLLPKVGFGVFDIKNSAVAENLFGGISILDGALSQAVMIEEECNTVRSYLEQDKKDGYWPAKGIARPKTGMQESKRVQSSNIESQAATGRYYKDAIGRLFQSQTIHFGGFELSFSSFEYDRSELEKVIGQIKIGDEGRLNLTHYSIFMRLTKVENYDIATIIARPKSLAGPYSQIHLQLIAQAEVVTLKIDVTPKDKASTLGELLFEIAKNLVIHINTFNRCRNLEKKGFNVPGYSVLGQAIGNELVDKTDMAPDYDKIGEIQTEGLLRSSAARELEVHDLDMPDKISELLKSMRQGLLSYSEFMKIKKGCMAVYALQAKYR